MTPKERMARAMAGAVPDRVPVMCQMSVGHMLLQTGLSPSEFWHSPEAYAEGLVSLRELYGFDGILISLHGHSPGWRRGVARREKDAEGERLYWKNGDMTLCPYDDLPLARSEAGQVRPEFESFDPEALPAAISHIPVSQGLRFSLDAERLFDILGLVRERAGSAFSLHGEVTSPLDYTLDLFGFEQAMVGFLEDPGRAAAVLERFTEGLVRLAGGWVEAGADAVKISSPYAGAGFLSVAFYDRFVRPYEARIAGAVEARGGRAYVHTCGDISDRLDLIASSGASGLECLDPPPLGRVDLAEAKRRVGGRLFIKGNIDPVHVLLPGGPERVREDARLRLRAGMPGGGYVLSTACSVAPRTPREHVRVLREAADEFGRY